ncbi:hypothetical protein COBT_002392, partial [Conglomerata obtusa]
MQASISIKIHIEKNPSRSKINEPMICMFNNYDKDGQINNLVNQKNRFLLAILNFTMLKLASGLFDVYEKNYNNFFNWDKSKKGQEVRYLFEFKKIAKSYIEHLDKKEKDLQMNLKCEKKRGIEEKNNFNIIILEACFFIYKNLIISCKKMGIKYDVNVFSISYFVDFVFSIVEDSK